MATTIQPKVTGFTIETDELDLVFRVQDKKGNFLDDLDIALLCTGPGTSDAISIDNYQNNGSGIVRLGVRPGIDCAIEITKECFAPYQQKFTLVAKGSLNNPNKNFVIKVVDTGNNPISGATVDIFRPGNTINGTTDANGFFEGEIDPDTINSLTVSKAGFQNFVFDFQTFLPFETTSLNFVIVPYIILTV